MNLYSAVIHSADRDVIRFPHTSLLPELRTFGWSRIKRAARRFKEHAHNGYEFFYFVSGKVEWSAPDGIREVGAGDVYVTRPNERHGGQDSMMHPCEIYWLIIDIPVQTPLPGMTLEQTRVLRERFERMRLRCFAGSEAIHENFRRILEEHKAPGPLSAVRARAALHNLLMDVLCDHDADLKERRRRERQRHAAVTQAVRRIEQDPGENWRVQELAESCGLGLRRFHALFARQTGFTPAEYRNRRRVQEAKRLLVTDKASVTELSYRLGFSSSQYFSTVFKTFTGSTPREYRRGMRGQA